MDAKLRSLVDETIASTEPPTGPILEVFSRSRPTLLVCLGLMQQSRRNLAALVALNDADLADAGMPLVRSIFENTVTGGWLLDGDNERLSLFLGAQRKQYEDAVDEGHLPLESLDTYDELMDDWVGHHKSDRLPGIRKRLGKGLDPIYDVYRRLSARSHGSVVSTMLQFDLDDHEDMVLASGDAEEGKEYIRFSAQLLLALAFKLWAPMSEDVKVDLADLYARLTDC